MAKPSSTLWGIHAGKTGDADQLFLKDNVVAHEDELGFKPPLVKVHKALLPLKRVYVPELLDDSQ